MDSDTEFVPHEVLQELRRKRPRRGQSRDQRMLGVFSRDDDDDDGGGYGGAGLGMGRGGDSSSDDGDAGEYAAAPASAAAAAGAPRSKFVAATTTAPSSGNGSDKPAKRSTGGGSTSRRKDDSAGGVVAAAKWEKHTKGVGSKLLAKMGYTGGGLGRERTGIASAIEVKLRPARAGLGAAGDERTKSERRAARPGSDDEREEEFQDELATLRSTGRVGGSSGERRHKQKISFRSAASVAAEAAGQPSAVASSISSSTPLIDMSAPGGARVLSGYDNIATMTAQQQQQALQESSTGEVSRSVPELVHNLRLLVDLAEHDVQQLGRRIRADRDAMVATRAQLERATTKAESETARLDRVEEVQKLLHMCSERDLSATALYELCQLLQSRYPEEYRVLDVKRVVLALVVAREQRDMSQWSPLEEPAEHIARWRRWRSVLDNDRNCIVVPESSRNGTVSSEGDGDGEGGEGDTTETVYALLAWHVWFPLVRPALTACSTRDGRAAVLLEHWVEVVPLWIGVLCAEIVCPKLEKAVELWSAQTSAEGTPDWLLAWLPLLGDRLPLKTVARKLANALLECPLGDADAVASVLPWKQVFSRRDMSSLVRVIVPRLQMELTEMDVSPASRDLSPFRWLLKWLPVIGQRQVVSLLDESFFPRFLAVLAHWLQQPQVDYDQVTRWFLDWKAVFPDSLLSHERIKQYFTRALDLMNRAVDPDAAMPEPTEPPPSRTSLAPTAFTHPSTAMASFRDTVQSLADAHGLLFMPLPNRRQDGHQVFSLGSGATARSLLLYLDRAVAFVYSSDRRKWLPTPLDKLIDLASV